MLTDIIKSSINAIETQAKLQHQKLAIDNLSIRMIKINQIGTKLSEALDIFQAIKTQGLGGSAYLKPEQKEAMLATLHACGIGVSDYSLDDNIVNSFKLQTDVFEKRVAECWKQVASKHASAVISELVIIGSLMPDPKTAQDILGWIQAALEAPPTPAEISEFIRYVRKAQVLASLYTINPEIQSFLLKVKEGKALVDDLTPEVLDWLRRNNLTRKLKVSSKI